VGRVAERRVLNERLHSLLRGEGSAVLLEGEAGIGKSHLLTDFAEHARLVGARVLWGEGDAIEQATSYYPWRSVVTQLLSHSGDGIDAMRAELLQRLNGVPKLADWAPLIGEIVPLGIEDNEITRAMESTSRSLSIRDLVAHLLQEAVTPSATILILDDAHWFDSNSLLVALDVLRRVRPLLVVIGTRPIGADAAPELGELLKTSGGVRLHLPPMADDAVVTLVGNLLGAGSLPQELTQLICRRTEGHPLHAGELALALRDTGRLIVQDGVCRLTADVEELESISPTLQAIITTRIDRLSVEEQLALKTASVIGRSFTLAELHDICPQDWSRERLQEHVSKLEREDLMHRATGQGDGAYTFKHVIGRDVAYNTMLPSQHRPLHRRVAEGLEGRYQNDLALHYPLLAYHWERAGEPAKTIDYLEKAGERAVQSFSNREAISFLTKAVELAKAENVTVEIEHRARWERYLGEANLRLTHRAARRHLQRSLELRGFRVPSSRPALVLDVAVQSARQVVHRWFPSRTARRSPQIRERRRIEADVYNRLLELAYFRADILATLDACLRTLNAGESAGAVSEEIFGCGSLAAMIGLAGWHKLAQSYAERAVLLADQSDQSNLADRAYARLLVSNYWISVGQWARLEELCSYAIDAYARLGDHFRWEMCRALEGFMGLGQGDFDRAQRAFAEIYESIGPDGAVGFRLSALTGQLASVIPRAERHIPFLTELERLIPDRGNTSVRILALGVLGLARLRRGEQASALERADSALELLSTITPGNYFLMWGTAAIAEVYLEAWEGGTNQNASLRGKARKACQILDRLSSRIPFAEPRARLSAGIFASLDGKPSRARELLSQSIAAAEKFAMPYEQGLARYELGRRLPLNDEMRTEHLNRAATIFTEIGAPYDLDRVRKVLDAR
jgi:hypothetical protein